VGTFGQKLRESEWFERMGFRAEDVAPHVARIARMVTWEPGGVDADADAVGAWEIVRDLTTEVPWFTALGPAEWATRREVEALPIVREALFRGRRPGRSMSWDVEQQNLRTARVLVARVARGAVLLAAVPRIADEAGAVVGARLGDGTLICTRCAEEKRARVLATFSVVRAAAGRARSRVALVEACWALREVLEDWGGESGAVGSGVAEVLRTSRVVDDLEWCAECEGMIGGTLSREGRQAAREWIARGIVRGGRGAGVVRRVRIRNTYGEDVGEVHVGPAFRGQVSVGG
jgi:hypothetical protein